MSAELIVLPRPRSARPIQDPLALFVRVGRNDHREMLELIATGDRGLFGFVIEAQHVGRHSELITEARARNFDLILDPKTQPLGLPGGHTPSLGGFPWGLKNRHHNLSDFANAAGRSKAEQIVEMAASHGFTQILGPTHLLTGPDDPWLPRDLDMMEWTREAVLSSGTDLGLIHSLALPMDVLRRPRERDTLLAAIADTRCDAIWLKVENFGDDATGEKMAAYVQACRDFHGRGIPLVGDHLGGLPGLGTLALGAVGGIAHGVTTHRRFTAAGWRRPSTPGHGGQARRVYVAQLDMLLKPAVAQSMLDTSPRVRGRYGCRDNHCCPHGVRDMIAHPARHTLYQRAREVEWLSQTPQAIRPSRYLDDRVRPVSDDVAAVASVAGLDERLRNALLRKQKSMSRFRQAMAHLAAARSDSVAIPPLQRATRELRRHA